MSGDELHELSERQDPRLLRALDVVAPGGALREGIDNIVHSRTGGLIVVGDLGDVSHLLSGGIKLDIDYTPAMLYQIAKMDGAIVLDREGGRILRAATQLLPDPSIETNESGTRHRTAERVAKQTGFPVVSVSQSMQIVALYVANRRHVLENSGAILSRANQALQTLERYKTRLDEVTGALSALEIEDLVTVRDVATVLRRLEMVRRIKEEIDSYVIELGTDGRLLTLQLEELTGGLGNDRELVISDYLQAAHNSDTVEQVLADLMKLTSIELLDLAAGAKAVGFIVGGDALDTPVSPRGYRLLTKVPRLPHAIVERLVDHFGSLQKLLAANLEDLMAVEGVGEGRARAVREGLSRLAESSILERYV